MPRGKILKFPGPGLRTPSPEAPGQPAGPGLVEVYRCDQAEALVLRSLLQSEGIPAVLRSRIAQSVHPFSVGDQGAVAILVPTREVVRTRRLVDARTSSRSRPAAQ
jgi:hypothetical protein